MKLLHIIATPRIKDSRTLRISKEFLKVLKEKNPKLEIDELDLFKAELPEVYVDAVDAKYALLGGTELSEPAKSSWVEIARYANEFLSYDRYLISTPMWNFTVPYRLKQYIDVIMQPGLLFKFTEQGAQGLALHKKMYCISSRGSDYSVGSQMQTFDFLSPYIKSIFGMAGIYDIEFIDAQPLDYNPELAEVVINKAIQDIQKLN